MLDIIMKTLQDKSLNFFHIILEVFMRLECNYFFKIMTFIFHPSSN